MSFIQSDHKPGNRALPLSFSNWSRPIVEMPAEGVGSESKAIEDFLGHLAQMPKLREPVDDLASAVTQYQQFWSQSANFLRIPFNEDKRFKAVWRSQNEDTVERSLYETLAAFKVRTAQVAMHLDRDVRSRLFRQLDSLLGVEDWIPEDQPPSLASFSTFLRMMLALKPVRRPGLGATGDGHLIAMWTVEEDRLTIECLPDDRIRWVVSRVLEEQPESTAGTADLIRLPDLLAPYNPNRWFGNDDDLHSA